MLFPTYRFISAPVFEDEEKTRQASVLNFIVLTMLITLILPTFGVFMATSPTPFALLAVAITMLLGLTTLILLYRGYVDRASLFFSGGGWLILAVASAFFNGIEGNTFNYLILIILIAGLTLGWRAGIGFAMLSLMAGLLFLVAKLYNILPQPLEGTSPTTVWANKTALFVMATVFVYVATRSLNKALERARSNEEQIKKQQATLEELVETRTAELKQANQQLRQEIAERNQIEQELQRQRDFAVQVMNALGQGITVTNNDGYFEYVNPAYVHMLGYSKEKILSKQPKDFTLSEDWETLSQARDERRSGKATHYDLRMRRSDGSIMHALVTAVPRWEGNHITGTIAITADLTERQRAAEALKRREAILAAVAFAAEQFLKTSAWADNIQNVLAQLGQATGVSRVYIAQNHPGPDGSLEVSQRYEWAAAGITVQIDNPELQNLNWQTRGFGRWMKLLQEGQLICSHTRHLPNQENKMLIDHDIQSILVMPIFVDQTWWGIMGFDDCLREREWSAAEMEALKAAGATLGAAIQRKRIETALRQSETRLRQIIDLVPHFIFAKDRQGHFILVNQAFAEAMGATTQELIGRAALQITPSKKDTIKFLKDDQEVITTGKPKFISEETFTDVHDKLRIFQTYKIPFTAWGSQEPAVLGVAVDITEQKQAEDALRESEERFRATFEQAAVGIAHVGLDGRWLRVNQKLCHMLGYTRDELLAKTFIEISYPDSIELNLEYIRQITAGEIQTYSLEKRYTHKNGSTVWCHVTVSLVRNSSGEPKYLISVIEDITRRKNLEAQLRHSQKLEAIGRLAGGIAHDFNNILTVIIGNSELLLYNFEENNPLRKDVEQIKKVAERAASLTRQLLAFSRQQVLEARALNLNTVIADTEQMLRRLIGEHIELQTRLAPDLGFVKADPGQMEQVILNLAVNARDAMPGGGRLTIETAGAILNRADLDDQPEVEPGPFVTLIVSDTGPGIADEILAHIFEPFFTTKEVGEGTGLGLATVHGIITQSSGFIRVHSQPGQGTTFIIYLPQAETSPDLPQPLPAAIQPHRGSETILLAEDEQAVRELAHRVLSESGYTVLEAHNGPEALHLSEQYQGVIDLLLTDVLMPGGLSGPQLAEALSAAGRHLKVLYMSGYTDKALAHHGLLEAGINLITKPFSPDTLISKVRQILAVAD